MNAIASITRPAVRAADLACAREVARIDRYLAEQPDASPFHRPAWSIGVARGTGHRAHYLLAEKNGRLAGALPLTEVRSRLFGPSLVSAAFAVDGGILAEDEQAAEALAATAPVLASRLGCLGVELRGGQLPETWHRQEGVYASFARDLPPKEEAMLKAIPRKQRAEVRRALSSGLQAEVGGDLAAHYQVYSESVRNLGTPVFPAALFAQVLAALGEDADILTVRHDGRAVASVLSLYWRGTVYPFWGGGTKRARALNANDFLYFALMRHAAARGCTRFDFGRSKLGTGPYAYKKNWGFEPRPLTYACWGAHRDTNPLSTRYRLQVAAWKRLPLWLANRLGPQIAKGLG